MTGMIQDFRYAIRMLSKAPGFTVVAVLTLALGIGANTALFSVLNRVLFKPLPYPQPEQLLTVDESKPNFEPGSISYPSFLDCQKDNRTFTAIALCRSSDFRLTGIGEAVAVGGEFVSSELFPLLGVKPLFGRSFAPDDTSEKTR